MAREACTGFLHWALPQLGKRWTGFRPVQQQVCRCLVDRLTTLSLRSFDAYRDYLQEHPDEWDAVDACCRITISRFYRDAPVFDRLRADELPRLMARARGTLRCWSAGAASGERRRTRSPSCGKRRFCPVSRIIACASWPPTPSSIC